MGSRWYTPDFHVVTIDISAFVTTCYQSLHPGLEEICVKYFSREVAACFTSACVRNCVPAGYFSRGSKRYYPQFHHTAKQTCDYLPNCGLSSPPSANSCRLHMQKYLLSYNNCFLKDFSSIFNNYVGKS
jgi:hypothetical protein